MNLRGIANAVTTSINPNITVTIKKSNGFTVGAGAKQVPAYITTTGVKAQMQALDGNDLNQMDGLNITGTLRALYVYGSLSGTIRPTGQGGDLVTIDGKDWLVVRVLESWTDWCKVAICLQ